MRTKVCKTWRRLAVMLAVCSGAGLAVAQPVKLAEFQFNEGSGSVTRSTINDLTGTLGVAANPDNAPQIITDSPSGAANDRAVQLRGTGYLLVDDRTDPLLALATEPFTVETWVRWDGVDFDQFSGLMAYGGAYKLGLNSGQIIWTLFGVVDIESGHILPADSLWHHVAAVYEPGVGVTIYLDGVPSFIAETRPMGPFANNWLFIGAEGFGNQLQASFDRLRIHKGLLSAEQLDSVANSPKPVLDSTLVAYDFNEAAMPFQSAKAPARPTMTSEQYLVTSTAPRFSADTPTGGAGDYSMEFYSPGQRVIVPDLNTAIRLDNGDFTIQTWIKFGPQAARAVLFFNSGPGMAVSFSVLNREIFVTTLGILDRDSDAPIADDGSWHHIAVVHETGKEFRFYVDGILRDTKAYTSGVLIDVRTDAQFYIGSEPTGGLPFVGKLDRLTVSKGMVPPEQLDYRVIPGVDPGAPELSISTVVEVSWPSLPAGYKLQSTTNIADPNSWVDVPNTPYAGEGTYRVYLPIAGEKTFYRLFKP